MRTLEDVITRIKEYWEEEFGLDDEIEDLCNVSIAYTEMYTSELPKRYRWGHGPVVGVRISMNLDTLTCFIHAGGVLIDAHTFKNYDELYQWIDTFEFDNIFLLRIL